ncbi:MAG: hypothetical protein HND49_09855 [Planctomycetes bacterium]|nr:hypothetical protein [Planctomycetota bacterium]
MDSTHEGKLRKVIREKLRVIAKIICICIDRMASHLSIDSLSRYCSILTDAREIKD